MASKGSELAQRGGGSEMLGHHEERWWARDYDAPSIGRKAGAYQVFVPARIADRAFDFSGAAAAAVTDASRALARLGRSGEEPLADIAQSLLRSESAASSRIEGMQSTQRHLARATFARQHGRSTSRRIAEVLGNVEAMQKAIELGASTAALTTEDILGIHRTLLRFTDDAEIAGVLRKQQSWIGGSDYHPIGARYVGPPHELVPELLEDLCAFLSRDDLPGVAQAAIAHAQFENIHPFADGNGRTGRALIYVVLRRRGEIADYIPPVSLVLGSHPKEYVSGLGAYSIGKVSVWCERFSEATRRAASEAEHLASRIAGLQQTWLERLGRPRKDAAVRQIIAALPEQPVIDVAAAQVITSKSHVAVGSALSQLQDADVLQVLNERRWGRAWECGELLKLVDEFEKAVSTP